MLQGGAFDSGQCQREAKGDKHQMQSQVGAEASGKLDTADEKEVPHSENYLANGCLHDTPFGSFARIFVAALSSSVATFTLC